MSAVLRVTHELGDIVDQLRAQGIAADLDRDAVDLPGVWVTTSGVTLDGLDFYTVHARLIVLAADRPATEALPDFDHVTNAVLALFGNPDGDLTPVTVARAGAALPGFSIPLDFRCNYPGGDQ